MYNLNFYCGTGSNSEQRGMSPEEKQRQKEELERERIKKEYKERENEALDATKIVIDNYYYFGRPTPTSTIRGMANIGGAIESAQPTSAPPTRIAQSNLTHISVGNVSHTAKYSNGQKSDSCCSIS